MSTDTCRHCGYAIPVESSLCSGCGRRHSSRAPVLEDRKLPHSPLLREARWARRLVAVVGWLGLALVLAAVARAVVGVDAVAEELQGDAALRLDHAGRVIAGAALIASVGAIGAVSAWVVRTRRNATALAVDHDLRSPWALPGWLVPGRPAQAAKAQVDQVWREASPLVGALPERGSSRRLVSRVVFRPWSLWVWVPATAVLAAVALHADEGALHRELGLAALAAGALLVATARAYYDVIGIITAAHAHQAQHVIDRGWSVPWGDETPSLEPLAG